MISTTDLESGRETVITRIPTYYYERLLMLLGFVALCVFVALYITFVALGIKALVETGPEESYAMCRNTNLWWYLLFAILTTNRWFTESAPQTSICLEFVFSAVSVGWGLQELFGVDCAGNLRHTLLYQMSFIHVVANIVELAVLYIFVFYICIMK